MFDDPKKELQELEGQLLAAEMSDEEFEKFYDEVLEEYGPGHGQDSNSSAVSTEEPPIRNFANGYGGNPQTQPLGFEGDELLDDEEEPIAPRKGVKGLVILACLECLAIAGLAVYWVLNFM